MTEYRHFATNAPGLLYYKWNGNAMFYTSFPQADESWIYELGGTPENLNHYYYGVYDSSDPRYAYETDENWNRLEG